METEGVSVAQTAVHLSPGCKVLQSECAGTNTALHTQGPASRQCVAELPGRMDQVLFRSDVLGEVPALPVARKDDLELDLALLLCTCLAVASSQVVASVVPNHFKKALVGPVDVLILKVDDRVDPVLVHQRTHAVLN